MGVTLLAPEYAVCVQNVGQNLKKREGAGNIRRGLAPLCELYQETLKISHPPIVKPTSPPWLSPISSKNFLSPPPPLQPFLKNFIHSPLYERGKGRGVRTT